MKLVNAEELFAECNVAVHLIKIIVNRGNEVMIDLNGYLGTVERRLDRAVIFTRSCEEEELFELGVESGSHRVFELAEAVIIGLEDLFSEVDILALEHRNERAVR
jgi:hypothetical protein